MAGSKSLIGRGNICKFLTISKNTFYRLVKAGLPVSKKLGIWTGHADKIDDFIKELPPENLTEK